MSNQLLLKYHIGLYKDNTFTNKMRFEDKECFSYLLTRNLSLLVADDRGLNIIHHSIAMEKLDYLAFMLEGVFYQPSLTETLTDQQCYKKAKAIFRRIISKKYPWISEALYALETNDKNRDSCLHMAID